MRAVVQRVSRAEVRTGGTTASIERGLVVLLGVGKDDTDADAIWLAWKIPRLRIFQGADGTFDLSLKDVDGGLLVVSQFTLYGDARKGRRPSFVDAAQPARAEVLYELFVNRLRAEGWVVATGVFGAMMDVELVNDGPFTLLLERSQSTTSSRTHAIPDEM